MGPPDRRICLDTGLLIQALRGTSPGAEATAYAVQTYACSVTALTVYELTLGAARLGRDIGEARLLRTFSTLAFDETAARRAAALENVMIRQNQRIALVDMMIAAICLVNDVPLLTLNVHDFRRVPGLTLLMPQDILPKP